MNNDDISDDEFDAFLNGKDALSRRLQALPQAAPSAELDAAILNRARELMAQESRPQAANDAGPAVVTVPRLAPSFSQRWRVPVGIAATLLAGVIGHQAYQENGDDLLRDDRALNVPAREVGKADVAQEAKAVVEAKIISPEIAAAPPVMEMSPPPPPPQAAMAAPAPAPAVVSKEKATLAAPPSEPPLKEAPKLDLAESRVEMKPAAPAPAAPPAPAPPPPPSPAPAPVEYRAAGALAKSTGYSEAPPVTAAPAYRRPVSVAEDSAIANAGTVAVPATRGRMNSSLSVNESRRVEITGSSVKAEQGPTDWLAKIDALLNAKRDSEALTEWNKFRALYPDYPVTKEMLAKMTGLTEAAPPAK